MLPGVLQGAHGLHRALAPVCEILHVSEALGPSEVSFLLQNGHSCCCKDQGQAKDNKSTK